jgi:hypothetical protein
MPMKRIRRISLTVEHREVSVTITQNATGSEDFATAQMGRASVRPEKCPDCGAPWLADSHGALREAFLADFLGHLHLHCQPDGQFSVCERSFQQFRGTV